VHIEIGLGSGTDAGGTYYDSRIIGRFAFGRRYKFLRLGTWFGYPVKLMYGTFKGIGSQYPGRPFKEN
jgi:hypothetical protein